MPTVCLKVKITTTVLERCTKTILIKLFVVIPSIFLITDDGMVINYNTQF